MTTNPNSPSNIEKIINEATGTTPEQRRAATGARLDAFKKVLTERGMEGSRSPSLGLGLGDRTGDTVCRSNLVNQTGNQASGTAVAVSATPTPKAIKPWKKKPSKKRSTKGSR